MLHSLNWMLIHFCRKFSVVLFLRHSLFFACGDVSSRCWVLSTVVGWHVCPPVDGLLQCRILCSRYCHHRVLRYPLDIWSVTCLLPFLVMSLIADIYVLVLRWLRMLSILCHCWLGGREHTACKKLIEEVLMWLSVCCKEQMIYIWSYWCHCYSIITCFIRI